MPWLARRVARGFAHMRRNRPLATCLNVAPSCEHESFLKFTRKGSAVATAVDIAEARFLQKWHGENISTISVPCGPLSKYLGLVGVFKIDLFSLDVEGAELQVLPRTHAVGSMLRRCQGSWATWSTLASGTSVPPSSVRMATSSCVVGALDRYS